MTEIKAEETCKIVYLVDGVPKKCGGRIKEEAIRDTSQDIRDGDPLPIRYRNLLVYSWCEKCRIVYHCGYDDDKEG